MADQAITDMTEKTSVSGSELLYADDNGSDVAFTVTNAVKGRIDDTTAAATKLYSSSKIQAHFDDATIHAVLIDEDDMVSDDDERVPSQQSVKAFVDAHTTDTSNPHSVTKAQVGLPNTPDIKHNSTTTDPTVNDDSSANYVPGSTWINTASGNSFTAISVAVGAAVWERTNNPDIIWDRYFLIEAFDTGSVARKVFTDLGDYDAWILDISHGVVATDGATVFIKFSQDAGSSYVEASGNYTYLGTSQITTTETPAGNTLTQIPLTLTVGVGNAAPERFSFNVLLWNFNETNYRASAEWRGMHHNTSTGVLKVDGYAELNANTDPVDAFKIEASSGNISIKGKLWGVKRALV